MCTDLGMIVPQLLISPFLQARNMKLTAFLMIYLQCLCKTRRIFFSSCVLSQQTFISEGQNCFKCYVCYTHHSCCFFLFMSLISFLSACSAVVPLQGESFLNSEGLGLLAACLLQMPATHQSPKHRWLGLLLHLGCIESKMSSLMDSEPK